MTTLARIQSVLQKALAVPDLEIDPKMSAKDIPEWDSFSHISIIVGLEKEFAITFDDGELQALQNIGEMVRIIEERMA